MDDVVDGLGLVIEGGNRGEEMGDHVSSPDQAVVGNVR